MILINYAYVIDVDFIYNEEDGSTQFLNCFGAPTLHSLCCLKYFSNLNYENHIILHRFVYSF